MRQWLMAAMLALPLLAAGNGLKNRYEQAGHPDIRFVMQQVHEIFEIIDDRAQPLEQREQEILSRFDAAEARMAGNPRFTSYINPGDFEERCGDLYVALINFYDGENNPSRAALFAERGAEQAYAVGMFGNYVEFLSKAVERYLQVGRFDRADAQRTVLADFVGELFSVDTSTSPAEQDLFSLFYHQYLGDLALKSQLAQDRLPPRESLQAAWDFRQQAQASYPELRLMQTSDHIHEVKGIRDTAAERPHERIDGDALRDYGLALAVYGDEQRALMAVRMLDATHQHGIATTTEVAERAVRARLQRGARPSKKQRQVIYLSMMRNGIRSLVWQHWDPALINYYLGNTDQAREQVDAAVAAFADVTAHYKKLDDRFRNVDNIDRDFHEILLLQAKIAEAQGSWAVAASGYESVIEWSESARESMALDARQHFFRSFARSAYLGRVRVLAQDNSPVNELIPAIESFRARQLKEQLGITSESNGQTSELVNALADDEAFILFTDLDTSTLTVCDDAARLVNTPPDQTDRVGSVSFDLRKALVANKAFEPGTYRSVTAQLIGPLQSELDGIARLRVLNDGSLSILPVALLPLPDGTLFADQFIISHLPSLAFLDAGPSDITTKGLFAVGDPVYAPANRLTADQSQYLASTRGSSWLSAFDPLPETRREVEQIAGSLGGDALLALGEDAMESRIKQMDLTQYRYLHFATHGVLGGEVPGLYEPALVLAHEDKEDGFLTASEVVGLDLRAEITVLSACNTGNGEYFRGEGLMGMGRAFLLAGSRNVLVSLWPVDSLATEQLMVAFYEALQSSGEPAAALAEAQAGLRQSSGHQSGERGLMVSGQSRGEAQGLRQPVLLVPVHTCQS